MATNFCYFSNDLWAHAATELPDNIKRNINFNRPDKLNILAELHATAEQSRQRSIESRWKYTRKNGEVVIVRDVLGKIVRWVDTFKQVGDAAIQYDPGHASLPWAGIRFLLQVSCTIKPRKEAADPSVGCGQRYRQIWVGSGSPGSGSRADLSLRAYRTTISSRHIKGNQSAGIGCGETICTHFSIPIYGEAISRTGNIKYVHDFCDETVIDTPPERIARSAFLTESDLSSGLDEMEAAEKDVDRCMALVDRMGLYQHLLILQ